MHDAPPVVFAVRIVQAIQLVGAAKTAGTGTPIRYLPRDVRMNALFAFSASLFSDFHIKSHDSISVEENIQVIEGVVCHYIFKFVKVTVPSERYALLLFYG